MSDKIVKEQRRLTIAELRKLKNYEGVSDEHAQEIIFAVKNLAVIFYEYLNKKKKDKESGEEGENKQVKEDEYKNEIEELVSNDDKENNKVKIKSNKAA